MNRARAYVNDAWSASGNPNAGRILTDAAPFSIEYLNGALEELQDALRDYGVITLILDNYIMTPILAVPNPDPTIEQIIAYTGFYDGVTWHELPQLPATMVAPLFMWERMTGTDNEFTPMEQPQAGLEPRWQCETLGTWEWRAGPAGDAIYLNGATTGRDLRLRSQTQLAPIAPASPSNPWSNVQISVLASIESLAHMTAYRYARARGSQFAAVLKADGESAKHSILNRYVKQEQGIRRDRVAYDRDAHGFRIPGII